MTTNHPFLAIGVDVGKRSLEIALGPDVPKTTLLRNHPDDIASWLAQLDPHTCAIALEATGPYHLDLCLQAHQAGFAVFVLDGLRLSRYRDSIGQRAKTDACDARLLARYLAHEHPRLRPWCPPPTAYRRLLGLLRRRAQLVRTRTRLEADQRRSTDDPLLHQAYEPLLAALRTTIATLERLILRTLEEADWLDHAQRLQAIEGIGPLTAAALTTAFHRGTFHSSDAFVAFLGLDVRVRESGSRRHRRRLSKQGEPEMRRLLYLSAMRMAQHPRWQPLVERYRARGLAPTQIFVILARKLARIAFAMLRDGSTYQPPAMPQPAANT